MVQVKFHSWGELNFCSTRRAVAPSPTLSLPLGKHNYFTYRFFLSLGFAKLFGQQCCMRLRSCICYRCFRPRSVMPPVRPTHHRAPNSSTVSLATCNGRIAKCLTTESTSKNTYPKMSRTPQQPTI